MSVINLWVGGATHERARVIGKASAGASSIRLLVSTSPNVSNPTVFGPVGPDAQDIVDITATGLDPGTRYYFGLDEDMTFDSTVDFVGTFRTADVAPGTPFSFTFASGGCAGAGPPAFPGDGTELDPAHVSNHPVFDELASRGLSEDWLLFVHTGDFHYYNIGTDKTADLATYRRAYDDVLHQAFQQDLYKGMPLVYVWDDHDFDGNNSDGTYEHKLLAQQVYRERVPSHTLAVDGTHPTNNPIYHSFEVGRVLFVVTDNRSSRSPNGDPDDENKTMLGVAQKTWLDSVLAASNAKLLIWVNSVPWVQGAGNESWSGYTTEAAELIDMFRDRGFLNRMFAITGDAHYMAMDDGSNTPGGIPLFVSNHLDSSPSGNTVTWSEGPPINNKGQYGTVEIADDGIGDNIDVTWKGWATGGQLLRQFTISFPILVEPPTTPQQQEPVLPSPATVESVVTWLVCRVENQEGAHPVVAELPDMRGDNVSRVLGEYTPSSLELPIPAVGGRDLTLVQRAAFTRTLLMPATPRIIIVAVINDVPVWAGLPLRPVGGTEETVRIACPSVEAYTTRRYVRGHSFVDDDVVSVIAAELLTDAERPVEGLGGGLGFIIDAPESGVVDSRTYHDSDNATVYEKLTELMGAKLIEWTVDPEWSDDRQNRVSLIARVRPRIGAAVPEAMFQVAADSVFQAQGSSSTTYNHEIDFGSGRFANVVQAYSTGEGEDQPRSELAIDTAQLQSGVPIFEDRFQPASNLSGGVLDQHAQARLERVRNGSRLWQVNARWDAYPRYGIHWRLGDDISFDLVGHLHPGDPAGGHRARGTGRAIGVQFDFDNGTVRPILLDPQAATA